MSKSPFKVTCNDIRSPSEKTLLNELLRILKSDKIPDAELIENLGLFMSRREVTKLLFAYDIYTKILDVHGVIMEFGTRWGQNIAYFSTLRGILEPYNWSRKIIGFDTFEGFQEFDKKDGKDICKYDFTVTEHWESYLDIIMESHEADAPISHIKKYEIIKGDVSETVPEYLEKHPETIIALAFFDLDLYVPTRNTLKAILPHCTKSTVLVFDQPSKELCPGETIGIWEVMDLTGKQLKRSPFSIYQAYMVL